MWGIIKPWSWQEIPEINNPVDYLKTLFEWQKFANNALLALTQEQSAQLLRVLKWPVFDYKNSDVQLVANSSVIKIDDYFKSIWTSFDSILTFLTDYNLRVVEALENKK